MFHCCLQHLDVSSQLAAVETAMLSVDPALLSHCHNGTYIHVVSLRGNGAFAPRWMKGASCCFAWKGLSGA